MEEREAVLVIARGQLKRKEQQHALKEIEIAKLRDRIKQAEIDLAKIEKQIQRKREKIAALEAGD